MNNDNLQRIERVPLRDRVYRAIQQAIVSGDLEAGGRVRDLELAAQLGVSRTPVREALQRLEDEGLVETAPGAFTRVVPLDSRAARDAFPVVAALHALATRLAVPHLDEAHLATLDAANSLLAQALDSGSVPDAIAADDSFHQVFVLAADNGEIGTSLARLMPKVRRLEFAQFGTLAGRQSVEQHTAIQAAVASGDTNAAAALAEENWLSLGRLIVASLIGATGKR